MNRRKLELVMTLFLLAAAWYLPPRAAALVSSVFAETDGKGVIVIDPGQEGGR